MEKKQKRQKKASSSKKHANAPEKKQAEPFQTREDPLNSELKELEGLRVQPHKEYKEEKPAPKPTFRIKEYDVKLPAWFYMGSIFAAFLFTAYISIFAAIHFEDIRLMNITIMFFFISMVSFFLVSASYFISERKKAHYAYPMIFFIGIAAIMLYAFKAVDTSNLVRYSIMYTIIVTAASVYMIIVKGKDGS